MGERVQIARQDTLLEVQTTGTQTKNTLDVVNEKIGNFGDTAEEGTLFGQMAGGSGSTGTVKSVQRGVITSVPNTGSSGKVYEIPINTVDPNKSFVILNTGNLSSGGGRNGDGIILTELLANVLKVKVCTFNTSAGNNFSWQVIECF